MTILIQPARSETHKKKTQPTYKLRTPSDTELSPAMQPVQSHLKVMLAHPINTMN
jgi:hypothetical protein